MRLLVDTHCWLWAIIEPQRLSPAARELMADGDTELLLSAVCVWEIAIKYAKGKLRLPEPPAQFVPKRLVRDRMTALAITHHHALHVASLPLHHRDPFDRLLIAQAQVEGLPILTADPAFARYDVELFPGA